MKLKSQKGSIALFVLIALLFYMGFLLLMYANNLNKIQTITEGIDFLQSVYGKNINNIDEVYNRRIMENDKVQPIIKDIPDTIIVNTTQLQESYVEYGQTGGKTEYKAFEQTFSTLNELVEYVTINDLYGTCDININAYGNNGLITKENIQIEILSEDMQIDNNNTTEDTNNIENAIE